MPARALSLCRSQQRLQSIDASRPRASLDQVALELVGSSLSLRQSSHQRLDVLLERMHDPRDAMGVAIMGVMGGRMGVVTGGVIHDVMGVVTWQLLGRDSDAHQTIVAGPPRPLLVAGHKA